MDKKIVRESFFIALIILSATFSCKAQQIIPMYDSSVELPKNGYLKDIDNDLDDFVGVWKHEDNNKEITIQFKKIEKFYDEKLFEYSDYLIGEYLFIKNGTVLINTLPTTYEGDPSDHNAIYSISIYDHGDRSFPECNDCPSKSRYISLNIDDPIKSKLCGEINMVHYVQNGVRKIKMFIASKGACYAEIDDIVTDFNLSIADGEYIFTKVD